MKTVCAWCRADIVPGEDAGPVSHGICPPCAAMFDHPESEAVTHFLDGFGFPVAVVDPSGVVRSLNAAAEGLAGKRRSDAAGRPGGVVFSCKNASLPGGCGKTAHCSSCTVRNAVEETSRTGLPRAGARAHIDQEGRRLDMLISTEKVGTMVLLRIDQVPAAP